MRLGAAHPALEQRIKVNSGSCKLFVRPSIEDGHHRFFDHSSKTGLPAKVIPHTVGDFGKWFNHEQHQIIKNGKPAAGLWSTAAGFRNSEVVSFNLLAGHDHVHAAFVPMMIGMISVMVMGDRESHSSITSVNALYNEPNTPCQGRSK